MRSAVEMIKMMIARNIWDLPRRLLPGGRRRAGTPRLTRYNRQQTILRSVNTSLEQDIKIWHNPHLPPRPSAPNASSELNCSQLT